MGGIGIGVRLAPVGSQIAVAIGPAWGALTHAGTPLALTRNDVVGAACGSASSAVREIRKEARCRVLAPIGAQVSVTIGMAGAANADAFALLAAEELHVVAAAGGPTAATMRKCGEQIGLAAIGTQVVVTVAVAGIANADAFVLLAAGGLHVAATASSITASTVRECGKQTRLAAVGAQIVIAVAVIDLADAGTGTILALRLRNMRRIAGFIASPAVARISHGVNALAST